MTSGADIATLAVLAKRIPWCPHTPTAPQRRFLALDSFEALYGGAAGGGKSDALLMAALRYVDRPGYSAIIFRRTYTDLALPGAIMDRARAWLAGTAAKWNERDKRFTFPSGAALAFGYLETDADRFRYAGAEFQFVAFDELTQFAQAQYLFLLSRIRRTHSSGDIPLRVRAATNPGGVGHAWVKERFVDPGDPSRPFVPALVDDNPHLDVESYKQALSLLDQATRDQLLSGVWVVDGASRVYKFDRARNECDALPEYFPSPRRILAIDLGASEQQATTGIVRITWSPHDPVTYVTKSRKVKGLIPSGLADICKREMDEANGELTIVMDEGALGKGYGNEMRSRYGLPVVAAEKRDKLGFRKLLNGAFEQGMVKFVCGECDGLRSELESLVWNAAGTDVADRLADHESDALLYGWRWSYAHRAEAISKGPPVGTPDWYEAEAQRLFDEEYERAARARDEGSWRNW